MKGRKAWVSLISRMKTDRGVKPTSLDFIRKSIGQKPMLFSFLGPTIVHMIFRVDSPSLLAFLAIVLFLLGFFLVSYFVASRRLGRSAFSVTIWALVGLLIYLSACLFVVSSGVLESHPMPALPLFILALILIATAFGLASPGKLLATGLPIWLMVIFQGFRLPLELVLHAWVSEGLIPQTMTWTGQNFDIVAGALALVIAPFTLRRPRWAWIPNVVGFLLLLNVIRVAAFSSPLPFAWDVSPPLVLAMHIPYFLIGPVCVVGALIGHIVLTRALLKSHS